MTTACSFQDTLYQTDNLTYYGMCVDEDSYACLGPYISTLPCAPGFVCCFQPHTVPCDNNNSISGTCEIRSGCAGQSVSRLCRAWPDDVDCCVGDTPVMTTPMSGVTTPQFTGGSAAQQQTSSQMTGSSNSTLLTATIATSSPVMIFTPAPPAPGNNGAVIGAGVAAAVFFVIVVGLAAYFCFGNALKNARNARRSRMIVDGNGVVMQPGYTAGTPYSTPSRSPPEAASAAITMPVVPPGMSSKEFPSYSFESGKEKLDY
jgi:hypothetical protein